MSEKAFARKNGVNAVLVYLFLYVNCSMYSIEVFSTPVKLILSSALIFFIGFNAGKTILIKSRQLQFVAFGGGLLVVLAGLSMMINTVYVGNDVPTLISLFEAIAICLLMNRKEFMRAYVDAMVIASIFGLATFALIFFAPGLLNFFPTRLWHYTITFHDLGIAAVADSSQYIRNNGMFYEPGQMGFYTCIAIAFWFIIRDEKTRKWKMVVLAVAAISTLSTAGVLSSILIIAAYIISRSSDFNFHIDRNRLPKIFAFVAAVLIGFFAFAYLLPENFKYFVNKFSEINLSDTQITQGAGSGFERWRSILIALDAIAQSPVIGIGGSGFRVYGAQNMISTAAVLNWFGYYGFLYGLICCAAFFALFLKSVKGVLSRALLLVGLLILLLTQAVEGDVFVFAIILYSLEMNVAYKHEAPSFMKKSDLISQTDQGRLMASCLLEANAR